MLKFEDYISNLPDLPYNNFAEMVDAISRAHGGKDAIMYRSGGQKEFTRWSYERFGNECRRVARGLLAAGFVKGDRIVLWAENQPQWMAVWMGTIIAGLCIVPVDFLLTEQECLNIMKISRAKAFFYSSRKKNFADSLPSSNLNLSLSVCISSEANFDQFGVNADNQVLPSADSILPTDPASIVFTSGTTGFAKGVTLSHKNIIANSSAAIRVLVPDNRDVFMNVLPLHHTYPTTCSFIMPLSVGATIVIAEKILGKVIIDDIRDSGVTFLIGVPLLYDKIMAALEAKYNNIPVIVRGPLNLLRKIALAKAKKGNPEFGRKVFRFIRKKATLQSVQIVISGGGPLSVKTSDFFDSLGFNIIQGYGMSENSPLISVNTPRHKRNESVGLPVIYTDVKILDHSADGIGEIAVKSPSIMLGYFENEEATKEVMTQDGYLLTGDLGRIDELGFIHILGRKKSLIIGSGGKNIYPEEIEAHFYSSRFVSEVLIVGRKEPSGGEIIYAVIFPNFDIIKENFPDKEDDDGFVYETIKKEVEMANRSLPVYKKISGFAIRKEPFEKNAQQKIKRFLYKSYETP